MYLCEYRYIYLTMLLLMRCGYGVRVQWLPWLPEGVQCPFRVCSANGQWMNHNRWFLLSHSVIIALNLPLLFLNVRRLMCWGIGVTCDGRVNQRVDSPADSPDSQDSPGWFPVLISSRIWYQSLGDGWKRRQPVDEEIQNGGWRRPMGAEWRRWAQFIGASFSLSLLFCCLIWMGGSTDWQLTAGCSDGCSSVSLCRNNCHCCQTVPRFRRVPPGSTGFHRVPPGSTGFHRVPPGSTGFHWAATSVFDLFSRVCIRR